MMWLQGLIGVATGIISGFGIGGGSLLVLYLTVFAGYPSTPPAGSICYTLSAALRRRSSGTSDRKTSSGKPYCGAAWRGSRQRSRFRFWQLPSIPPCCTGCLAWCCCISV